MTTVFGVFHTSRPTPELLKTIRATQAKLDVTYAEIGATLTSLPAGYHHLRTERTLSGSAASADDLFAYGRDAISSWAAQHALNLILEPTIPEFVEGEILVFALPMKPSPFWTTGSCRIIRIVDEPSRYGFVYGTLPHHPEIGEEAFLVERNDTGRVWCSVTAFSRGGSIPMRMSGAMGRFVQRRASKIYLDGYERYVAARVHADVSQLIGPRQRYLDYRSRATGH